MLCFKVQNVVQRAKCVQKVQAFSLLADPQRMSYSCIGINRWHHMAYTIHEVYTPHGSLMFYVCRKPLPTYLGPSERGAFF